MCRNAGNSPGVSHVASQTKKKELLFLMLSVLYFTSLVGSFAQVNKAVIYAF